MTEWTPRRGLLLINVGTPDEATVPAVRRYLREFLSDPRVIDIPAIARTMLLEGIILPRRPAASTEAYGKVWGERGSPVLMHGIDLRDRLREHLGDEVQVELAMRYQNPSIAGALDAFRAKGVDRITVLPLYPQYSSAATGSAQEEVWRLAGERWNTPFLDVVPPFYDHPAFLDAFAGVARPVLAGAQADRVLFSFHGLPERQIRKSDEAPADAPHCLASEDCCEHIVAANRNCYRAQCFHTAREIAARLALPADGWEVTFQSRLGRTPWIQPYTDVRLQELGKQGVRRLAVLCPAFVADCLETLEEIAMRGREDFRAHGGEELTLVPSLNSDPAWVAAAARIAGLEPAP